LGAFRRYLAAKGNGAGHVQKTHQEARDVIAGCKFTFAADMQPSAVVEFLARLRDPGAIPEVPDRESFTTREVADLLGVKPNRVFYYARRRRIPWTQTPEGRRYPRAGVVTFLERRRRGAGGSTSNHYLVAVKAFSKWMVKDGRVAADPLAHLERQNAKADLRRQRRPMSQEQFSTLVLATMNGEEFRGFRGEDRAFLYLLAADSGL